MQGRIPGVQPMRDCFNQMVPPRPNSRGIGIIPKKKGHFPFACENGLDDSISGTA